MGELTELVGIDDLDVLAADLGALGTLIGIHPLPTGEVDGLDALLRQETINRIVVTVLGEAAASISRSSTPNSSASLLTASRRSLLGLCRQ